MNGLKAYFGAWVLGLAAMAAMSCSGPVHAQPAKSVGGQYAVCETLAKDVVIAARATKLPGWAGWTPSAASDWYTRTVLAHAEAANKSGNVAEYTRALHKACLLETA